MLKIFNTLTKKKEQFQPINANKVKIYVCGITVYDLCHLGHGRTFIVFDMIIRYLMYCGYNIEYVRNITDIDDKIIKKAHSTQETVNQLTNRIIQEMYVDLDSLNILRPTYEPKVTEYIDIIINFIQLLIKKKHAYITFDGNVFFSLNTMHNYGMLSQRLPTNSIIKYQNMYDCNSIKHNPNDFVLWKSSKPGEPYWIAPWGKGRPGWHIECSAMCHSILGNHIDIHGGGSDLIFPHHDNEIAQSTCAFNTYHVNTWMHVGMLYINNEKMSKSLNNFFSIQDTLKQYDSETIRFFLLSAHYRNQLQYSHHNLRNARLSLEHLYLALRDIDLSVKPNGGEYFISKFINKMNDDFNTPEAYSVLFEIAHTLNVLKKNKNYFQATGIAATLKYLANILGILYQRPEIYLTTCIPLKKQYMHLNLLEIQKLIQNRENARKNRQWEIADQIRKKLRIIGIILEDEPTGKTKWRYYV